MADLRPFFFGGAGIVDLRPGRVALKKTGKKKVSGVPDFAKSAGIAVLRVFLHGESESDICV